MDIKQAVISDAQEKIMKNILSIASIILALPVSASEWEGNVSEIETRVTSNVVLFKLTGELKDSPRCNHKNMYAIDLSLPGGENIFEMIKLAYIHKAAVHARGLNTCSSHTKAESVKVIFSK